MVVEAFAEPLRADWSERWEGRVARARCGGDDLVLVLPQTFMNLSGRSVGQVARFFHIEPSDVLVVHDEVDLPLGRVTVKLGGGDAGHKGIRSVIECLGTKEFARVRVGVGRPASLEEGEVTDYVLHPFGEGDWGLVDQAVEKAVVAIKDWVVGGVPKAQNRANRRERPARAPSCPGEKRTPGPQDRKEVE
jgi:PTH1 family peptidyl-tRNA hydrolase